MRKKFSRRAILFSVFILLAVAGSSQGQQLATEVDSVSKSDTLASWPHKLKSRTTWDVIAYTPGWLVYAPYKYTMMGLGYLSTYKVDVSWVQQIQDFMISDDGRRGVLPTYSARGGGGLKFYQKDLVADGTYLSLKATMSIDFRQRYQAHVKEIPIFSRSWTAETLVRYQLLTTESFFGVGPKSRISDRTRYGHEQTVVHLSLSKAWAKSLRTKGILGYEYTGVMKSRKSDFPAITDTYSESVLSGVKERAGLATARIEMQFDNKNRPGYPTTGMEATFGSAIFHDMNDSDFGFWKLSADVRRYIHLFYGRTIMLRLAGEQTKPMSPRRIPFTYLSELGGSTTIRGFMQGRFQDRDMLMGYLEYRYPIWEPMGRVLDAAIFTDFGQVSDDIFSNAAIRDVQVGYGGGFRFYGRAGLAVKFEIAFSRETTRVYLKIN